MALELMEWGQAVVGIEMGMRAAAPTRDRVMSHEMLHEP